MIIFRFVGVIAIAIGVLSIVSDRFDAMVHQWFPDSALDQRLLSPESRYLIRRYLSGLKGIIGGVLAILLYVSSDPHIYAAIAGWVHAVIGR
jgi:hypothetical protein